MRRRRWPTLFSFCCELAPIIVRGVAVDRVHVHGRTASSLTATARASLLLLGRSAGTTASRTTALRCELDDQLRSLDAVIGAAVLARLMGGWPAPGKIRVVEAGLDL